MLAAVANAIRRKGRPDRIQHHVCTVCRRYAQRQTCEPKNPKLAKLFGFKGAGAARTVKSARGPDRAATRRIMVEPQLAAMPLVGSKWHSRPKSRLTWLCSRATKLHSSWEDLWLNSIKDEGVDFRGHLRRPHFTANDTPHRVPDVWGKHRYDDFKTTGLHLLSL